MITNFQSKYTYGNKKNAGIKIAHWNKGNSYIINKMTEIRLIVEQHKPHILGLSEANLLASQDKSLAYLADYNLHLCKTMTNLGLGTSRVVVYTHKDLVVKLREDLMSNDISSIWLEVGLPGHKKFLVCQAYREWQQVNQNGDKSSSTIPQQLARWLTFLSQWEAALATNMEVHCLGDMNLNHCNWTDTNLSSSNQSYKLRGLITALFSRIFPHGVTQLVSGPTRHAPGQVLTGLDHYYTNRTDKVSNIEKHYCGGSDHMLISGVRHSKSIRSSPKYIRKRCYKNFDSEVFVSRVQQLQWLDVYLCEDVDEAVHLLCSNLTNILDEMAPMRTIQIRTKYNQFISKETLEMMKNRDNLLKIASETKNKDDWKNYKLLRNKINNRLKYEENKGKKEAVEDCGNNPARVWKKVKCILKWNSSGSPSQLFYKGALRTKSQDIADCQNEYFVEKVAQLIAKMPPSVSDPLYKLKSLMDKRTCSFSLAPVYPDQVEKIISSLSNSTSFGLDQIDTSTIKLIKKEILPAITHIINLSISTGKFPSAWKKAKVVPLFKKEDPVNPKNYRPVAIIPILSKVLERVIFNQMIEYLTENRLLHPNHHAFRPHHNTSTAMIQMYDGWIQAVESGQIAGVCMLDMSAAFDLVDHDLLLQKLLLYGFGPRILDWIKSYLTDRTQCVVINGALSRQLPVSTGVPQGSILGPLLYTMFTNELPEIIHTHLEQLPGHLVEQEQEWPPYHLGGADTGGLCCYADDSTLTCTGSRPDEVTNKLTEKYSVISEFMRNNKLKLNDDKTHLLVMDTGQSRVRNQENKLVEIRTSTDIIYPSSSGKLLGCWISNNLKWSEHIQDSKDNLILSLTARLAALKKISRVSSFKNRKMLANGVFLSKVSNLIALWGGCTNELRRSLQVIQNKVARVVTRLDWSTPTKVLLSQLGWLSINQLVFYHSVLIIYKVKKERSPKYIHSMFNQSYQYNTRQAESGLIKHVRGPNLDISKSSFRWRAADQYNQLPLEIRTSQSTNAFKVNAKNWIKDHIPMN